MNGGARLRQVLIRWIAIRAREDARPTRFMGSLVPTKLRHYTPRDKAD